MTLPGSDNRGIGMMDGVETIYSLELKIIDKGDCSSIVCMGTTGDYCRYLGVGHFVLSSSLLVPCCILTLGT